jgi:hypothetical protein
VAQSQEDGNVPREDRDDLSVGWQVHLDVVDAQGALCRRPQLRCPMDGHCLGEAHQILPRKDTALAPEPRPAHVGIHKGNELARMLRGLSDAERCCPVLGLRDVNPGRESGTHGL